VDDALMKEYINTLSKSVTILDAHNQRGQTIVYIHPEDNVHALEVLKGLGFYVLSEMSAIDWIAQRGGFEVFYQLLNIGTTRRIRIKCFITKNQAINTVSGLYRSADWSEREMYDMFGIQVNNHPNLKRMLLPDDWHDHPLLKTYPLHGDEVAQWYEVDLIYGKEYREKIGPEQRDAAYVNESDTKNFARVGHEVEFGAPATQEVTPIEYQEPNAHPLLIRKMNQQNQKTLKKRK
jgi:NADH-quinone oxidoreductase subunit C